MTVDKKQDLNSSAPLPKFLSRVFGKLLVVNKREGERERKRPWNLGVEKVMKTFNVEEMCGREKKEVKIIPKSESSFCAERVSKKERVPPLSLKCEDDLQVFS